jgi:hypothetical protein
MENLPQKPTLSDWQAVTLRMTAFTEADVQDKLLGWWDEIVGIMPENDVRRSREGMHQIDAQYEEGRLAGRLALATMPTRIDWVYGTSAESVAIGLFTASLDKFIPIVDSWLPKAPRMSRLAFGAVVHMPSESKEGAYKLLVPLLFPNVHIDPEKSSDFLYQINRPRTLQSGIPELLANRLAKWSVVQINELRGSIPSQGQMILSPVFKSPQYFSRVEVDINTSSEYKGVFAPEATAHVFGELVALGKEIISEGDKV